MALLFGYTSDLTTIYEDIDMNGNKITDLPDPTSTTELVTKGYADTHYSGGSGGGQEGPRVIKDLRVTRVIKVHKDLKVTPDCKDHKDLRVTQVREVLKVIQDRKV